METVDQEFLGAALDFIDRSAQCQQAVVRVFNSTRMHVFTHLSPQADGKTGLGLYPDGMVEHDGHVGQLLKKLDDLKIADNTIVVYTTDNGAEAMTWPDGGTTPFRGEKATNWEGSYRVPTVIRWSGVIKPSTVHNQMFAHEDFLPTFAAAGGDPDVVERCKKGCQSGNKRFKVHLDGYNLMPFFKGEVKESPRKEFRYWSDDGDLFAVRIQSWKIVFIEQNHTGLDIWMRGFDRLRVPKLFNLLADPFEKGDTSAKRREHQHKKGPPHRVGGATWATSGHLRALRGPRDRETVSRAGSGYAGAAPSAGGLGGPSRPPTSTGGRPRYDRWRASSPRGRPRRTGASRSCSADGSGSLTVD